MSSVSRKIRKSSLQAKSPLLATDFSAKLAQVTQVSEQLIGVAMAVNDVNEKLRDLDNLLLEVNNVQNLVTQSLQNSQAVNQELEYQRYVTLKLLRTDRKSVV